MKTYRLAYLLGIALLSAPTPGLAADAEAGLAVVKTLGTVNGHALACSEMGVAARARQLMLAHAPKTPRFGAAYEEATNEAFNTQTRSGKACASGTELTAQINQLAVQLADSLPVAAK
jgi:hypothetical protein